MTDKELWDKSGISGMYEAWAFGGAPDKLARLVVSGIKTATCSALVLFEMEDEPIPKPGDYSVILDSVGNAVCIIRTTRVYVVPFEDVSKDHAFKEGEGDRSLGYWRAVHEEFFTEELATVHLQFDKRMELVCEEFELVFH
jgi:uncharacterized protein YhfF